MKSRRKVREMVNNDQERRSMMAILMCLVVYMVWMAFFAPPMPPPGDAENNTTLTTDDNGQTVAASDPGEQAVQTIGDASITETVPKTVTPPPEVVKYAPHGKWFTETGWKGEVHSDDGALRFVELVDYSAPPDVLPLWTWVIDSFFGDESEQTEESGWVPYSGGEDPQMLLGENGALMLAGYGRPNDDGSHRISPEDAVGESKGILAKRAYANGLVVTKSYRPGTSPYTLDVEVSFRNGGDQAIEQLWVGVADHMEGDSGRFTSAIRPLISVDQSVEHIHDLDDLENDNKEMFLGAIDWFGIGDRYFMAVLVPETTENGELVVDTLASGRTGSFLIDDQTLDAGATRVLRFTAFLGPKNLDYLRPLEHNMDAAVEYGWFGFFAKILLFLLKMFQKGVVNWGVSIILLTVLVKLAFFPLTQKSFTSSRRMQALQPKLKEVKEKFKDNKELQTQETMKLFRENKVNPMGGCLPTLIQFPVWIALYNVMLNSVELYDTSFLYLKDLTAADPYGVLPTAYAGLMVFQQRMMPMTSLDPAQQKMMRMMPLVFAFFMYGFPSGLVLYFSVNIMLSAFQQWLINRNFQDQSASAK